jgi:CubicO group peptidase (beta-lactamase class C family)
MISATARTALALLLLGTAVVSSARAAVPDQPADAHELTAADAEAYLDGLMPYALQAGDVAGAVVVVVKDGQTLFEKGYGVADVEHRTPVDPKTTLFRPGSVSKLFTWTAVMQLVEQGKLDLDKDVNAYLDFQIPASWSKPITLRDLMTHTAGFEETLEHLGTYDQKSLMKLDDLLKAWVPTRIFPPGEVSAYSNYGAALAGYIVQRVSGEAFDEYVGRHILQPLAMTRSSFAQPLPDALAKDMAKGYPRASEPAVPFELVGPGPAGSLSATGDDMAHFMIAQLADGAYGDVQILKPETAALMRKPAFTPVPPLPGMALGFYHEDCNGHDIIGHGGDTVVFHSDLHLILDAKVGLFVSMNSAGKDGAAQDIRAALFHGFLDRYYPAAPAAPEPTLASARQDADAIAGTYEPTRRSETNFIRFGALLGDPPTLSVNDDDTISFSEYLDHAGVPKRWREVAPFQWRDVASDSRLVAIRHDGTVERLASTDLPPVLDFTPVRTMAAASWNHALLFATLGLLLLISLAWPAGAVLRWHYSRPLGGAARLHRLSHGVVLLHFLFLAGWCGVLVYGATHVTAFDTPLDPVLRVLQLIGVIAVIGTVAPLYGLYAASMDPARSWWRRLAPMVPALACLASVWFAFSQHLLTLGLDY